ncbi:hypothetical protein ACRE_048800 [Hapsidospora chrysogenum ATCC 11550]|uniref:Inhibitor I9 domain-containing protein n=1 Tax=Hapsidospora chrysogenum (strain ATCC 11550 / CBS 779.69 / DSM 880 / IAM 14645 / JCM 23072 / IMI 49137) TaxID=857340 RepID=A0A086T4P2_HAPC1|nr:hypothetical protein ACRE_048800 [Hapsidospora chrysogenum ATCC 11550]
MRPAGFLLAALAVVPGVLAKSAVVYFEDKNTPDSYIQKAKDDIIAKGGKITHVYSIIKGFAVEAPDEALQTVQAWGTEHSMRIEEDKVMSIDN